MLKGTPWTIISLKKGDTRGTPQNICFRFVMKSLLCLTLSRFEDYFLIHVEGYEFLEWIG